MMNCNRFLCILIFFMSWVGALYLRLRDASRTSLNIKSRLASTSYTFLFFFSVITRKEKGAWYCKLPQNKLKNHM